MQLLLLSICLDAAVVQAVLLRNPPATSDTELLKVTHNTGTRVSNSMGTLEMGRAATAKPPSIDHRTSTVVLIGKANQSADPLVGNVAPPVCPNDVSEKSAYMTEVVNNDEAYTICEWRKPCNRPGTNLERVSSIRGLLKRTKQLMDDIKVPYALYGGSALGQERCKDVLPHDVDCDVIVWMKDVEKIRAGDLDSRYTVMHRDDSEHKARGQNPSIPFLVVDKDTGFYCDIFFMDLHPGTTEPFVAFAWDRGAHLCPWMSMSYPFSEGYKRCDLMPAEIVQPLVPCVLDGVEHTCFHHQDAYVALEYGQNAVDKPNVQTSS